MIEDDSDDPKSAIPETSAAPPAEPEIVELQKDDIVNDQREETRGGAMEVLGKAGKPLMVTASILLFHLMNCLDHPEKPPLDVETIIDSTYYWAVTIATIGYGDMHPETTLTKLIFVAFVALTVTVGYKYAEEIINKLLNKRDLKLKNRFSENQIQVSVCCVKQGELMMQTPQVDSISSVIGNHALEIELIRKAVKQAQTTPQDQPLVEFSEDEREYIGSVLKPVVFRNLGINMTDITDQETEVVEEDYWVAITWEKYGMTRHLTPRLIIVPAWSLEDEALNQKEIKVHKPHQNLRLTTMRAMKADIDSGSPKSCFCVRTYKKNPS